MKQNIINRRKKTIIDFKKFIMFLIFFLFILTFFYFFLNKQNFLTITKNYIQKFSDVNGYTLINLEIADTKYLDRNEILKYFKSFKNESIFLIPIKKISKEIILNKWVENVQIKSDYKNTLTINIHEAIPYGIYHNNNQNLLFSSNLVILEIINDEKKYSDLVTFYGKNSIINSKILMSNFDSEFLNMVESAIFVNNRRWDIFLKNNILLKLPETNIKQAIKNYKKVYANLSNKDLKEINSIDLRINKQAIIKYKDLND